MTNERFDALFGAPARDPEIWLTPMHMDIAASIQAVLEEIVLRLTRGAGGRDRHAAICASPAAWRSIAWPTARSCATARFENIWMQPAAGDAGGALGAALAAYHLYAGKARAGADRTDGMAGAYLGPELYDQSGYRTAARGGRRAVHVTSAPTRWSHGPPPRSPTGRRSAGSRAAWNSGRARSATARSWAIRARRPCRSMLNLKVKYRESFRPFAPAVLREDVADWFELDADSPYMLLVAAVRGGPPPRR